MRTNNYIVAILVVLCITCSLGAQTPLGWKFKEGDRFFVKSEEITNQTIEYAQARMGGESKLVLVHAFTVKKVSKDGAVLEQKIESAQVKHSSDSKETDALADALKGAAFTLTLDSTGTITKYDGYEQLVAKFGKSNEAGAKIFKSAVPEESLTEPLTQLFSFGPPKPVKAGESWTRELSLPFAPLGTFRAENKYTHTGKAESSGSAAKVDLATKLTFRPPASSGDLPFKVLGGDFKESEGKGALVFDAELGRTLRLDLAWKIRGELTVESGGQKSKCGVEQEQTLRMQVSDKAP